MANTERACEIYEGICRVLDSKNWRYTRKDEDLSIILTVNGDDLAMDLIIMTDAERELVRIVSPLPFAMNEDKRIEGAIATCAITYKLADGSFDYDLDTGKIYFRLTSSFRGGCNIGDKLLEYMVDISLYTIDKYNDQLMALNKGYVKVESFFE